MPRGSKKSGRIAVEVMTNQRHELWFGHFVRGLHCDATSVAWVFPKSLLEFALRLSWAKNQDRSGITKLRNDLVVIVRKMSSIFSLSRIISRNLLSFKRTMIRFP